MYLYIYILCLCLGGGGVHIYYIYIYTHVNMYIDIYICTYEDTCMYTRMCIYRYVERNTYINKIMRRFYMYIHSIAKAKRVEAPIVHGKLLNKCRTFGCIILFGGAPCLWFKRDARRNTEIHFGGGLRTKTYPYRYSVGQRRMHTPIPQRSNSRKPHMPGGPTPSARDSWQQRLLRSLESRSCQVNGISCGILASMLKQSRAAHLPRIMQVAVLLIQAILASAS